MKTCRQCRYFYHSVKHDPSICINKKSPKFPNRISRDGRDHVCSLFRPIRHRYPLDIPKATKKKEHHSHDHPITGTLAEYKGRLRYIESIRGRHSGREIWILATGPTLDDIPDDFLHIDETIPPDEMGNTMPKVSITVKEAGIGFPNSTYNIWTFRDPALRHIYLPRGMVPSSFGRFIFTVYKSNRENFYGRNSLKATYMRFYRGGTLDIMRNVCDSIVAGNSSIYCGITTITHLAIEAAILLGASKISLVGCDRGYHNGKLRAQRRGMSRGYMWGSTDASGYELQRPGFYFLADYFKDHGVEIVRYFHGRGYETIEKDWEE